MNKKPKNINEARKASKLYEDIAENHYKIGLRDEWEKNYKKAVSEFKQAIKTNSIIIKRLNNIGLSYFDMTEYARAIEVYRRVISMNKKNINITYHLIASYNELGSNEKTNKTKELLSVLEQDTAKLYNILGDVLLNDLNRYEEAKESYEQAIKLNKDNDTASSYIGINKAQQKLQDIEKDRTEEEDATFALESYLYGKALENEGKYEEAIRAFKRVKKLNDSYIKKYDSEGIHYWEKKQYWDAVYAYHGTIRLRDWNIVALKGINNIYHTIEEYKENVEERTKWEEQLYIEQLNDAFNHNSIGLILHHDLKEYWDAEEAFNLAIDCNPNENSFIFNDNLHMVRRRKEKSYNK